MAFTTRRGRPRATIIHTDPGTPELRLKHALGLTAEPLDACLARELINVDQHWCGLHLRWLYTLRYGAPVLTTRYADRLDKTMPTEETELWRAMRECEYHDAVTLLHEHRRYEPVMRLCVFNEQPAFLNPRLREQSWRNPTLTHELLRSHHKLGEGLNILVKLWRNTRSAS